MCIGSHHCKNVIHFFCYKCGYSVFCNWYWYKVVVHWAARSPMEDFIVEICMFSPCLLDFILDEATFHFVQKCIHSNCLCVHNSGNTR